MAGFISLDDAKQFLNISGAGADTELPSFIDAATALWENRVGPVTVRTYSEWYDGGRTQIALRHTPVTSITSITESFSVSLDYTLTAETLDAGTGGGAWDYTFDPETGLLTRRSYGMVVPFAAGSRNIHVTYTAGYDTAPADIRHALLLLVQHLWQTQRGTMPMQGGENFNPAMTFTWPNRVQEVAQSYMVPGIA